MTDFVTPAARWSSEQEIDWRLLAEQSKPLAVTSVDALAWFNAAPEQARAQMVKGAGLDPEKEKTVLAAWQAAHKP